MNKWIFILALLLPVTIKAQNITVFAGTGGGYGGDGGPATAAGMPQAADGVFDEYGNYYFTASVGNRVRKIDTAGIISCIAGVGMAGGYNGDNIPATAAQLFGPIAARLDRKGNIYIADAGNNRIRKVNISTGIITTVAGNGTNIYGGDNGPATAAGLIDVLNICFDKWNNLYIADNSAHRIRKVDTFGIITTVAGTGIIGHTVDGVPATTANIRWTTGLVMDSTRNLYFVDSNYVRKIDASGILHTVAGNGNGTFIGDGMPATAAQMAPSKIAMDAFNQLYIADVYNKRIYKVDDAGILRHIAGDGGTGFLTGNGGPATAASINVPLGLAFDTCGNLIFTESNNGLIRKVNFNPNCWPVNIKETQQNEVAIYPNPTNEQLHIDGIQEGQKYRVHNVVGVIMQQGILMEGSNMIDLKQLPQGIYLVEVIGGDGRKAMSKIVKQ